MRMTEKGPFFPGFLCNQQPVEKPANPDCLGQKTHLPLTPSAHRQVAERFAGIRRRTFYGLDVRSESQFARLPDPKTDEGDEHDQNRDEYDSHEWPRRVVTCRSRITPQGVGSALSPRNTDAVDVAA